MASAKITQTLQNLREQLRKQQLQMYWVPASDEHLNEYVPPNKRRLEALTGFTGSAGTGIFCLDGKHHLFVDSRYHLQAEQEVDENLFEIHKLGKQGVLEPENWMANLQQNKQGQTLRVGIDPFIISVFQFNRTMKKIAEGGVILMAVSPNLVDLSLEGKRPPAPAQVIFPLDLNKAGVRSDEKLRKIRESMKKQNVAVLCLTELDEIAWITNLRGSDIPHNPVFESFALVTKNKAYCFCHAESNIVELKKRRTCWEFYPYDAFLPFLKKIVEQESGQIWMDAKHTTMGIYTTIPDSSRIYNRTNPVAGLKALKNPVEIACSEQAHRHSGKAKIRSFVHLEQQIAQAQHISEASYALDLYEFYASEPGFTDLSFPTIAAYGPNSAIVHYSTPDPRQFLKAGGLLLVDSGIQGNGGTTDDTRTIVIGTPDDRQREIYTRVLKAHIRLASQIFPEGTTGSGLDAITRADLWNSGMDFGHGTGHGVGAFLNVHEGPFRISPMAHDSGIPAGVILSNEPGYYETGWSGIRLENLYVVVVLDHLEPHPSGKKWLGFRPLTMIPFERKLICPEMLGSHEKKWLNQYHEEVLRQIGPMLENPVEQAWLEHACKIFE
ncbi:MAG: aminopeptidase P family protein [SAR324 cluster bacterium]|nr:aminopeptidase P family protein [SAR324 cluster bacterium]